MRFRHTDDARSCAAPQQRRYQGSCSAASVRIGCPVGLVAVGAGAVQSRVVSAAPEVLRTVRLRKRFESEGAPVRALRGIDLIVAAGEFIAVTGPSGCGKSTLLNLVAGLEAPSDGEVFLAGESFAGKDESELAHLRRRHVGFVFQFFNLLEDTSALAGSRCSSSSADSTRAGRRSCWSRTTSALPTLLNALCGCRTAASWAPRSRRRPSELQEAEVAAVRMRFRAEFRSRWRTWLTLAMLAGVAGGLVIAGIAGARRTDSALARHLDDYRFPDATVGLSNNSNSLRAVAWIRGLPLVQA